MRIIAIQQKKKKKLRENKISTHKYIHAQINTRTQIK
jgi:hypothetical protein